MRASSPSEQGVAPGGIAAFLDALERDPAVEPHGLIIQRHGHRIVEGYWAPHTGVGPRLVYSLSKTFTGTALALLLGEGRLTLDDPVADHLPALLEGADERTRRIRIRHLASLSSGHDRETILEALALDPGDPLRGFFTIPPDEEPGTRFAYNQTPVLALAAVLQDLSGERLVDYLRSRLLAPLGIDELRWAQARPGLDMGYSGVFTTLDAVARLGQLYLDDGVWNDRRVLPEGWVRQASSPQIDNPREPEVDWRQGYGFGLWRSRHGYRGDGAFGQFMVVLPDQDVVVAMFSCTERMQLVLDLMWEHLLPAMGGAAPPSPADAALAERLAGLALPTTADRCGGAAPAMPALSFSPAQVSPASQRSVSRVETTGERMIVCEGDRSSRCHSRLRGRPSIPRWQPVPRSSTTGASSWTSRSWPHRTGWRWSWNPPLRRSRRAGHWSPSSAPVSRRDSTRCTPRPAEAPLSSRTTRSRFDAHRTVRWRFACRRSTPSPPTTRGSRRISPSTAPQLRSTSIVTSSGPPRGAM